MYADDVRNLRCRGQRTDDGRRPGAERGEDLGGDRGVSLVAGMEPVGAAEITRPAIRSMKVVDPVEPVQADEGPAVTFTRLRDDRVKTRGRQPAADAKDARLRPRHGGDNSL